MIEFKLDTTESTTNEIKTARDLNSIYGYISIQTGGIQLFPHIRSITIKDAPSYQLNNFKDDFIFVFLLHCLSDISIIIGGETSTYEYTALPGDEFIIKPCDSNLIIIYSSPVNDVRCELNVETKEFFKELIKFSERSLEYSLNLNPSLKNNAYEEIFESRLTIAKEQFLKTYGDTI